MENILFHNPLFNIFLFDPASCRIFFRQDSGRPTLLRLINRLINFPKNSAINIFLYNSLGRNLSINQRGFNRKKNIIPQKMIQFLSLSIVIHVFMIFTITQTFD